MPNQAEAFLEGSSLQFKDLKSRCTHSPVIRTTNRNSSLELWLHIGNSIIRGHISQEMKSSCFKFVTLLLVFSRCCWPTEA